MEEKHGFLKKLLIAIALILFILFCASQKQAHALTYKGTSYSSYTSSNTKTGTLSAGQGYVDLTYVLSNQSPVDSSLLGFRLNSFNVEYSSYTNGHNISCSGYYNVNNNPQAINVQSSLSFTCTDLDTNLPIADTSYLISINANIIQLDRNNNNSQYQSPCWKSSEFQDTLICPNDKDDKLYGILITLRYNSPVDIFYRVDLTGLKFMLSYDNDDIINQNGVIISQQQETNDMLSGSDTTGASTKGTNDINSNATSLNSELDTVVGTGDFVSIFTTFFSQIDNSTCTPITLPIPYTNENLVLPCLGTEFQNRIPVLWTLYVTIITGVIVFRFWRFYIDMFKHLLDPYSTGLHGVSDIAGGGK